VLDSLELLSDAMQSFAAFCVDGIGANTQRVLDSLNRSLMLVTALVPHLGYDRAAEIARKADGEGTSLRAAAIASGHVSAAQFDSWVQPAAMLGPSGG
jgi:fumarate hydratase class II